MECSQAGVFVRYLNVLYDVGTLAGLTDAELLERFASESSEFAERAFEVLVERHGPMVLRVCRRTLNDPNDADDAFQAVFIVLARRAGAIRKRESVATWLHGVALRIASSMRAAARRRRHHEGNSTVPAQVATREDVPSNDMWAVVHEEIGRLPGRYRSAVVLCYVEGRTYEEASQILGCPIGTVKSRLATARETLRDRLMRRGVVPAVGAIAGMLAGERARATVPRTLLEAAVRAGSRIDMGKAVLAETVSAEAAALAEGALSTMAGKNLALALALVLAAGIGVIRIGAFAQQDPGGTPAQDRNDGPAPPSAGRPIGANRTRLASETRQSKIDFVPGLPQTTDDILNHRITLSTDDYPTLGSALEFLADRSGLSFVLGENEVKDIKAVKALKVHLECHGVALRSVIQMLLGPAGFGYRIDGRNIIVVSLDRTKVVQRAYDLNIPSGPLPEGGPPRRDADSIAEWITSTVAPGTWDFVDRERIGTAADDGTRPRGLIAVHRPTGRLTIRHTKRVCDEVARLLGRFYLLRLTVALATESEPRTFIMEVIAPTSQALPRVARDGKKALRNREKIT